MGQLVPACALAGLARLFGSAARRAGRRRRARGAPAERVHPPSASPAGRGTARLGHSDGLAAETHVHSG